MNYVYFGQITEKTYHGKTENNINIIASIIENRIGCYHELEIIAGNNSPMELRCGILGNAKRILISIKESDIEYGKITSIIKGEIEKLFEVEY